MGPRAYVIGTSTGYSMLYVPHRYHPELVRAKKLWVVPQRVDVDDVREHVNEGLCVFSYGTEGQLTRAYLG